MTSLTFIRSLFKRFGAQDNEPVLSREKFNRLLQAIDLLLEPLYGLVDKVDAKLRDVEQVALNRINDVIGPKIEAINQVAERGFLKASSATSVTFGTGNILTLVIPDEAERAVFVPAPFVAITRRANATDYAICRRISYEPQTGVLLVEVVAWGGEPGPHNDLEIAALAGAVVAQQGMLAEALTASELAIANAALTDEDAENTLADRIATAADRFATAGHVAAAQQFAAAAATFDPASFYAKAQVDALVGTLTEAIGTKAPAAATTTRFVEGETRLAVLEDVGYRHALALSLGGI